MKKTLVAILALGGMAMADVAQDIVYKEVTNTYTLNPETSTYGLDYAIDLSKAWSVTVTGTADFSQGYNQYGTLPVSMDSNTVWGQTPPIRMYLSAGKKVVVHPSSGEASYNLVEGTGDIVDYSITLSYNPNGAGANSGRVYLTFTVTDEEGHTTTQPGSQYWSTTLTRTCEELYGTLNVATQTNWTTPTITVTQMIAVPEPTTATLSLLALAGLAARRRRH